DYHCSAWDSSLTIYMF
nr:immunoglobulin light chain junction region [Macaca mulatta]MOY05053.1 immunoglobulin light chain junction region [Macaca mulatta]MOY05329.1 immunoglobulin light chain junction region [Macaca mulatta]MOY05489.1 immunoglobulin light chain junction region [Macaca mulatta]MOY05538.1 immunoglobulin light chain junction region [Macaca mulatta]